MLTKIVRPSASVFSQNQPLIGLRVFALATLLALCLLAQILQAQDLPRLLGTVTRVIDGDTIDVQVASGAIRVRLHAVDESERAQPWGRDAMAALADLVLGREIALEPFEQGAYDRLFARVFDGNDAQRSDLNEQRTTPPMLIPHHESGGRFLRAQFFSGLLERYREKTAEQAE